MNKQKFYLIVIVGLLISNIILVSFMVQPKRKHTKKRNAKEFIIKKMEFDENQVVAYEKLVKLNRAKVSGFEQEINNTKKELYKQLSTEQDNNVKDSLINRIGGIQMEIEQTHFNHFLELKKLCNADQLDKFNDLSLKLTKVFDRRKKHKK